MGAPEPTIKEYFIRSAIPCLSRDGFDSKPREWPVVIRQNETFFRQALFSLPLEGFFDYNKVDGRRARALTEVHGLPRRDQKGDDRPWIGNGPFR